MVITIPIRTVSEANQREHWSKRHRRNVAQQARVAWTLFGHEWTALPCRITLTRIAPRKLDPDNLAGSFKHVQDAVAKWLGVDDGDASLTWVYAQRKGAAKEYAVEVALEAIQEAREVNRG